MVKRMRANIRNTAAKSRLFDALRGLYPVTFDNVREADPEGLLDIFEGSEYTPDHYFKAVRSRDPRTAGQEWAKALSGCCDCNGCKKSRQQEGRELYQDIEQRIRELNG